MKYKSRKTIHSKWNGGLFKDIIDLRKGGTIEFSYYDSEGNSRRKKIKCLMDKEYLR